MNIMRPDDMGEEISDNEGTRETGESDPQAAPLPLKAVPGMDRTTTNPVIVNKSS